MTISFARRIMLHEVSDESWNIQKYNFACGSVWVRNLVSDVKGGT
jgi:hypothetical protein